MKNKRENSSNKYLDKIHKKEKSKWNNKILILLLLVLTFGGGIALYNKKQNSTYVKIFPKEDLEPVSEITVDSLTNEEASRYGMSLPEEDFSDTAELTDDFEEMDQFAIEEPLDETPISTEAEELEEKREVDLIPNISFRINGQQTEGEKLTFSIRGYDPKITYTMDFGNGRKKRMGRSTTFSYAKSGTFRPILTATNSSGDRKRAARTIIISEKEKTEAKEEVLLASRDTVPLETITSNDESDSEDVSIPNPAPEPPQEPKEEVVEDSQPTFNETPGTNTATPKAAAPNLRPLKFAQVMPSFPGGTAAMYDFLNKKLDYPTLAYDNQIEGNVYVQFVVHPDGSLSKFHILKGLGYGCDEEVIRVVQQMPKWNPGKHNDQIVPVIYTLKVNFKFK